MEMRRFVGGPKLIVTKSSFFFALSLCASPSLSLYLSLSPSLNHTFSILEAWLWHHPNLVLITMLLLKSCG